MNEHKVLQMPTFAVMRGGKEVGRQTSADATKLRALIHSILEPGAPAPALATTPAPVATPAPTSSSIPTAAVSRAPSDSVRIYVAGSASGAGKSTVSLALLGAVLEAGLCRADELAYIKPATQGVQQTLTAKFCVSRGIACRHVGPVVFYRGFTQAFLEGSTASSAEMLAEVRRAVDDISHGKRLTVIDGVGYPAVGSIVGVSNAAVARAVGAAVLLVGKAGLGDAVDSFNLSASYFEAAGVAVLGTILNRVPSGKMHDKTLLVSSYFEQHRPHERLYGLLLENDVFKAEHDGYAPPGETNACSITKGMPKPAQLSAEPCNDKELALCNSMVSGFTQAIGQRSLQALLADAQQARAAPQPQPRSPSSTIKWSASSSSSLSAPPWGSWRQPSRGQIALEVATRWLSAPASNAGLLALATTVLVAGVGMARSHR